MAIKHYHPQKVLPIYQPFDGNVIADKVKIFLKEF